MKGRVTSMPFESLSFRNTINIGEFPDRWLPLVHLYDPDLPLFPIYYFHSLRDVNDQRPNEADRVFGYVEKIGLFDNGTLDVTVITNKNLANNGTYRVLVEREVRERLGIANPVTQADVSNAFLNVLACANPVLDEIWYRTVSNSYGNMLPFGRLWDEVLGLTRFVASFYSPSGRKGELIQTHYFATKFGERIQCSGGVPQVDFYLLPTIQELTSNNPLVLFPNYALLVEIAHRFQTSCCSLINVSGLQLSKFNNPARGSFNTGKLMNIIEGIHFPHHCRPLALECFNTFNKGPNRTILFLMMLDDLRQGHLNPATLDSVQCGSVYDGLGGSYQSPKVIEIYAQQSFGNTSAMPIDTWIETFFKWPLMVYPTTKMRNIHTHIFGNSQNLGKVERLLWVAGQARKVHSSACNDALWCIKYGAPGGQPRGANPLACNICLSAIRNRCPAFNSIRHERICFNSVPTIGVNFSITTSAGENVTPNQTFVRCVGFSIYDNITDVFSPADNPNGYAPYPLHPQGDILTVEQFVNIY
jgi:hypothetical protein